MEIILVEDISPNAEAGFQAVNWHRSSVENVFPWSRSEVVSNTGESEETNQVVEIVSGLFFDVSLESVFSALHLPPHWTVVSTNI